MGQFSLADPGAFGAEETRGGFSQGTGTSGTPRWPGEAVTESWRHCELCRGGEELLPCPAGAWGLSFCSMNAPHTDCCPPALPTPGGEVTALPPPTFPRMCPSAPGSQEGRCLCNVCEGRQLQAMPSFTEWFYPGHYFFLQGGMLCHPEVLLLLPLPGEATQAALLLPQDLAHGEAGGCFPLCSHTEPLSASLLPPSSSSSRSICSGCFFPELQKLHFSKLNFLRYFFFISPGSPSDCFAAFHPLQFIIFYECY